MRPLSVQVEVNQYLATWLGVEDVVLIREDHLPDSGGKKRRALHDFAVKNKNLKHLHLLSYAGSHTAFSLSKLLPETMIHLYGTHYGGGIYEQTMVKTLEAQSNVKQLIGSSISMTTKFLGARILSNKDHFFMRIGGSLGEDKVTISAVSQVLEIIGQDHHHFLAVASGDLLNSILTRATRVTGILTQPPLIRVLKAMSLKHVKGIKQESLEKRMLTMKELKDITGNLWDPIFMGTVFSYLKSQEKLPPKLCIWITCPTGVEWVE